LELVEAIVFKTGKKKLADTIPDDEICGMRSWVITGIGAILTTLNTELKV